MIGSGNAYVGPRTGERDLSCSRGRDFIFSPWHSPPPLRTAFVCDDAPPLRRHAFQDQGEELVARKKLLAVLRLDLRSIGNGN